MEMNAYFDVYVADAQETLGNMMDYAVNSCGMEPDDIFVMFLSSGVAEQFEKGNPRYVTGMSGAELAKEIVLKVTGQELAEPEEYFIDKTPEYWCGWILAYYQWRTLRSFKKIHQILPLTEVIYMYPTHHEADVERFVETVNGIFWKRHNKTYLQQARENAGMSKEDVSMQTGISKQIIENLESDFKLIGKTDARLVFCLAHVLGCTMEDLMEI